MEHMATYAEALIFDTTRNVAAGGGGPAETKHVDVVEAAAGGGPVESKPGAIICTAACTVGVLKCLWISMFIAVGRLPAFARMGCAACTALCMSPSSGRSCARGGVAHRSWTPRTRSLSLCPRMRLSYASTAGFLMSHHRRVTPASKTPNRCLRINREAIAAKEIAGHLRWMSLIMLLMPSMRCTSPDAAIQIRRTKVK